MTVRESITLNSICLNTSFIQNSSSSAMNLWELPLKHILLFRKSELYLKGIWRIRTKRRFLLNSGRWFNKSINLSQNQKLKTWKMSKRYWRAMRMKYKWLSGKAKVTTWCMADYVVQFISYHFLLISSTFDWRLWFICPQNSSFSSKSLNIGKHISSLNCFCSICSYKIIRDFDKPD